jgi:predicted transcriptional regulator
MNLQTEKLNLLQTILNTTDESLIMDVKTLLSYRNSDWFKDLNLTTQKDILEGLAEADNGEIFAHSDVVKLFGKWGLK